MSRKRKRPKREVVWLKRWFGDDRSFGWGPRWVITEQPIVRVVYGQRRKKGK